MDPETIQWHEVGKGVQLIDVRAPRRVCTRHVDGAVNIPVDDLRASLDEVAGRRHRAQPSTPARLPRHPDPGAARPTGEEPGRGVPHLGSDLARVPAG